MKKIIIITVGILLFASCKRIRENNVVGSYNGTMNTVTTTYSPEGEVTQIDSLSEDVGFTIHKSSGSGFVVISGLDVEIPRKDLKYHTPYVFEESVGISKAKTIIELGPDELQFTRTENGVLLDNFTTFREENYLGFK